MSVIWRGPIMLARWIRANPSRVLAIVWLGGMATVTAVNGKRAYRAYQREEAVRVAEATPAGKRPPEAVQMLDVDEINQIQIDRMHANGLGAAGENDVDQATIDAARAARGHVAAVEGERVGGSGDVVVMTKGGLAGWLARNKDKTADPETLAWLRGEEAKDGTKAYASWAEGDSTIAAWLQRGKELHGGAKAGSGSGSGSGSGTGSGSGSGSGSKARFDLEAIGMAAVAAIRITREVPVLPDPTPAELSALQAWLPAGDGNTRIGVTVRAHHIVISVPARELFEPGAAELTASGKALVKQLAGLLGTVEHRDFQLVASTAERAMEVAGVLVVAGVDVTRLSMAVATDPDKPSLDIVLIAGAP